MMRRVAEAALIVAFFTGLTVLLTWPQAAHLRTHVPWFDDSLLSIWRISWIAHALGSPATSLLRAATASRSPLPTPRADSACEVTEVFESSCLWYLQRRGLRGESKHVR